MDNTEEMIRKQEEWTVETIQLKAKRNKLWTEPQGFCDNNNLCKLHEIGVPKGMRKWKKITIFKKKNNDSESSKKPELINPRSLVKY